jgi:hypothetical protein
VGVLVFRTEWSEETGSAKGETLQAISPVVLAKECF